MSNVLKKITTAAKAYRKKHPGASWKSAVKKAGSMYRSGSLKPKRKKAAPKKVARKKRAKRSASVGLVVTRSGALRKRRKAVSRKKATAPRKRRKAVTKKVTRRRVGSSRGPSTGAVVAIVGLGALLVYAMTKKPASSTYQPTGNAYRDSTATRIISIAEAAGLAATQIAALISKLNNSSDAQLQNISDQVESGADISQIA